MTEPIRCCSYEGMVDIECKNALSYSNIQKMYKEGNGHGIQVAEDLKDKECMIIKLCDEISDRLYQIEAIVYNRLENNND